MPRAASRCCSYVHCLKSGAQTPVHTSRRCRTILREETGLALADVRRVTPRAHTRTGPRRCLRSTRARGPASCEPPGAGHPAADTVRAAARPAPARLADGAIVSGSRREFEGGTGPSRFIKSVRLVLQAQHRRHARRGHRGGAAEATPTRRRGAGLRLPACRGAAEVARPGVLRGLPPARRGEVSAAGRAEPGRRGGRRAARWEP